VAADCVPVAYPAFHEHFLSGRTVMIGCPKFDDAQDYIDRFSEIFKIADIKDVTVLVMEVPCCAGLPGILQKARQNAGIDLPIKQKVINSRGKIIDEMVV